MDPRIASYLEQNKKWTESAEYHSPIDFKEMQRKGRERDDGTIIILACTDPRVTPEEFLGINHHTNKATVIRVAGGRAAAALPSLLVLSAVGNNGAKGVIMVVHHTDCGLVHHSDVEICEILSVHAKDETEKNMLRGMKFGAHESAEDTIREDVKLLRDASWFKGMQILGFVQDTKTGILNEVVGV